tara:strand:+ start:822 stop:1943 length:1122 start_codon:yes stop_codon:yes gene_type:complete
MSIKFSVYADGNIEGDDSPSILKSAKDLQSVSSYLTLRQQFGEDDVDDAERLLSQLFDEYRETEMLMFPYEPNIEAIVDYDFLSTDADYGVRRVDRYTLYLEPVKETDYPREALRFGLSIGDNLSLPSFMVGRYFKYNGSNETVFFNTDNLTVSLLADVDILSDSALENNFKKILLDIAKHESFGQVPQDIIQMILLEWMMTAGEGEDNVFGALTEIFSNGDAFRDAYREYTWEEEGDISRSDVKEILEDDLDTLILGISDSFEDYDFDLQDDYYTTLPELIAAILDQLIFEYGYLEAVVASKLQAVKEAYDDLPIRYISDLSTIVSESKSSGAYVLEVGMSWGSTLNFLLNSKQLERQRRITVGDTHLYDEF